MLWNLLKHNFQWDMCSQLLQEYYFQIYSQLRFLLGFVACKMHMTGLEMNDDKFRNVYKMTHPKKQSKTLQIFIRTAVFLGMIAFLVISFVK